MSEQVRFLLSPQLPPVLSPLGEEFVGPLPVPDLALDALSRFAKALGLTFDSLEEVEHFAREYFAYIISIEALNRPQSH